MACRWLESFDYMVTADLDERYNSITGSPSVAAVGRNGTSGASVSQSGGMNLTLPARQTWFVGMAWRTVSALPASRTPFLQFIDSASVHVSVNIEASGTITFYRGNNTTLLATSTTALSSATYYYLEFKVKIDDSAGELQLRINGVADTLSFVTGTSTTQDTRNANTATSSVFGLFGNGGSTLAQSVDDIYINDTDVLDADNPNDSFLGDIRVEALLPSGAGNSAQFTPSASTNVSNVDDATPDGDTTYNQSSTTNHVDTFAMGNLVSVGSVAAVEIINYARKTDAGSALIAPVQRIGSTDYVGTDVAPSTTYRFHGKLYDVSPATGLAYTSSEVNGMEAGYKKTG